jgi:epoxyqueuosine reductase
MARLAGSDRTQVDEGGAPAASRWASLALAIKAWGREFGFQKVGIADLDVSAAAAGLRDWLARGFHGDMGYMERHAGKRTAPAALVPGTLRVITARMDYMPQAAPPWPVLQAGERAYIARYALGRDYHKVLRGRLEALAGRVRGEVAELGHRVFTDSAPVLEVEYARKAGLGWRGKHTLLLSRDGGSYFFLGEIFVDIPLPPDPPVSAHCGRCTRCLDICPTRAIVAPYSLDARRCISYLTIELKGSIPVPLRPLIGNRVYGCDDCQLVCPWNKFARLTGEADFAVRHGLDQASLIDLFAWDEAQFEGNLAGSAIRRIGYERWLRNLAVGLGNAPRSARAASALRGRLDHPSALVREHVQWALARQEGGGDTRSS